MKNLILGVLAVIVLYPKLTLARDDMAGPFSLSSYYGIAFISPTDMNNAIISTSTASNKFTSETFYGGGLGVRLSSSVEFDVRDEQHGSSVTNNGANFTMSENILWAGFEFSLIHLDTLTIYGGVYGGYPLYAHATIADGFTQGNFDADKWACAMGLVGGNLMLGSHFSVFAELGYQQVAQGTLKNGNVSYAEGNNTNITMDMSGGRMLAGLALNF